MHVKARGDCSAERLLQHADPGSDQVTLDLRRTTWCDPSGLVALACVVESSQRRGLPVTLRAPSDPHVARYLATMRLTDLLDRLQVDHDLPSVRHRNPETLLPLQRFSKTSGARRLAEHVYDQTASESRPGAEALFLGLCETGENVHEHAGSGGGFVAAQRYDRSGRLVFAVGDAGRGMRATLRGRGAATYAEAIEMSVAEGTTGTDDRSRGNGLAEVLSSLTGLRGQLVVVTGSAWASWTGARARRATGRTAVKMRGTVLRGTVATS